MGRIMRQKANYYKRNKQEHILGEFTPQNA